MIWSKKIIRNWWKFFDAWACSQWCAIDYTQDKFEWKNDEEGRRIPYIYDGTKWLRINNLHIHSKDLKSGLSKQMS